MSIKPAFVKETLSTSGMFGVLYFVPDKTPGVSVMGYVWTFSAIYVQLLTKENEVKSVIESGQ